MRPSLTTILAILWATPLAMAQSASVVASRTSVPLGETVTVQIVISGHFDDTRGPDISDFDVVGRSSGTSVSIVNGQMQQEHRVTLELAPKRAGNLTIGPIELLSRGKVVASSRPVVIRVSGTGGQTAPAAPSEPAPAEQPPPLAKDALQQYAGKRWFLIPRVPDRTLYAGEPVYLEYVLYAASQVGVADARLEAPPALKGFVVNQARTQDSTVRRVTIGRIPYDERVLWRGAVTALGPGKAVLPQVVASVYVGDGFFVQTRRVGSEPVTVEFARLPEEGRPADFLEGTVGQFVIRATLDRTAVRVGEAALLTVEVTGSGNLSALRPPSIAAPAGLRVARVPASDLDETVVDRGGVSGKRAFQYLLTPEREGKFELGRLELPFFNPVTGRYERTRTEPLLVIASGGTAGPVQEAKREWVVPVIESSDLAPAPGPEEARTVGPGLFFAGLGSPVGIFLVAEVMARRRAYLERNAGTLARRRALAEAQKRLLEIASLQGSEFFGALDGVMRAFVQTRFGIAADACTYEELRRGLLAAGASSEATETLLAELEHCAFGRFAPSAAMDRDRAQSIERVRRCLVALDRAGGGGR